MASGQTRDVGGIIPKKSAVSGKIPTGTTAGEIFSNLADKKLWGYDGVNIFEYGSDTFLNLTGGTISGDIIVNSISANTYLGLPEDISLTSFTYNSANTFTLTNNTGGTLSAIINVMTGLTVNGGLSATTYTGDTITLNTSGSGTVGLLLNTVSNQDSKLHFSTNNAASARGRLYVEDASQTFNLYTFNSDTIFWNGNGLAQSKTLTLYTDTTAKFENKLTVGSLNIQNIPSGVSVYNLAIDSNGNVISAITNSIDVTRVQPGSNISTGGTGNNPVISVSNTPVFTSVTATSISATTFYSGSTSLQSILNNIGAGGGTQTFAQPGTNITTGGTSSLPTISVVSSPIFNNIVSSGAGQFNGLTASTLTATTIYGDGSNISGIRGAFGITIESSFEISLGEKKARLIAPYNCTITGWDIIGNTTGSCVVDVWKNTTVPTSGNTITGNQKPTLNNQQFNSSTNVSGWTTTVLVNDIFVFNVLSASNINTLTVTLRTRRN